MKWYIGGLCGLLGSVIIDGLEIAEKMTEKKSYPWRSKRQRNPLLVAIMIRAASAAVLTAMLSAGGSITSELSALMSGVSTPVIFRRLASTVISTLPVAAESGEPADRNSQRAS